MTQERSVKVVQGRATPGVQTIVGFGFNDMIRTVWIAGQRHGQLDTLQFAMVGNHLGVAMMDATGTPLQQRSSSIGANRGSDRAHKTIDTARILNTMASSTAQDGQETATVTASTSTTVSLSWGSVAAQIYFVIVALGAPDDGSYDQGMKSFQTPGTPGVVPTVTTSRANQISEFASGTTILGPQNNANFSEGSASDNGTAIPEVTNLCAVKQSQANFARSYSSNTVVYRNLTPSGGAVREEADIINLDDDGFDFNLFDADSNALYLHEAWFHGGESQITVVRPPLVTGVQVVPFDTQHIEAPHGLTFRNNGAELDASRPVAVYGLGYTSSDLFDAGSMGQHPGPLDTATKLLDDDNASILIDDTEVPYAGEVTAMTQDDFTLNWVVNTAKTYDVLVTSIVAVGGAPPAANPLLQRRRWKQPNVLSRSVGTNEVL